MEKITNNQAIGTESKDSIEHAKNRDLIIADSDSGQGEIVNESSRLGSVVLVEQDGDMNRFRLVEEYDLTNSTDDDIMKISINAPAGEALLGSKAGDIVEYTTHLGKKFSLRILEVI